MGNVKIHTINRAAAELLKQKKPRNFKFQHFQEKNLLKKDPTL